MNPRLILLLAGLLGPGLVSAALASPASAAAAAPATVPATVKAAVGADTSAAVGRAGVKKEKVRPAVTAPRVSAAWIAEAPPTARHNAAYLVLRNGNRADTLLAVETPVAEVVELHEMRMDQGLMRMRQEKTVALAANAELRLAPGGRHLMLINMKRALQTGERIPLILRFRRAGAITVEAEVRPLLAEDEEAASPPSHMHMH